MFFLYTGIILVYQKWRNCVRKEVSFKNRDRFIQLGIAIASLRKLRGMSQEKLAEKAGISRALVSVIEAPGMASPFSLEVFFNIADALEIDPAEWQRILEAPPTPNSAYFSQQKLIDLAMGLLGRGGLDRLKKKLYSVKK